MASGDQQSPTDGPSPKEASGLKAELSTFLRESSAYLQLRGKLFSIEAKEAGKIYGSKFGMVAIGLAITAVGYLLILTSLIGIIGAALDEQAEVTLRNWTGATLILSTVHLILGIILFKKGQGKKVDQDLFEYTRNELKNEQEWLKQKNKRS